MSNPLSQKIADYISARLEAKLEASQKALSKAEASGNLTDVEKQITKREKIKYNHQPNAWIENAAKLANKVSFATHGIKFTHSSAKGTNFIAKFESETPCGYIDSQTIPKTLIDVCVDDAAALFIPEFLSLEGTSGSNEVSSLSKLVQQNDVSAFLPFAESAEQAQQWLAGFQQALSNNELASHSLAKQVFFPVGIDKYHLLSPLHSSSMNQVIYESVQYAKFSEEQKELRKAKSKNNPSSAEIVAYPDLARLIHGGANTQNVSKQNNKRGGISYLFPTTPPDILPPNDLPDLKKSIFDGRVIRQKTFRLVRDLTHFILHNWSFIPWNKPRKDRYLSLIDDVADQVFEIGMLYRAKPANWTQLITEEHRLELAEQHWLDPNQDHIEHLGKTWRESCADRFGTWLLKQINYQLKKHNKLLSETDHHKFKRSFYLLLVELPNPKLFPNPELDIDEIDQSILVIDGESEQSNEQLAQNEPQGAQTHD